MITLAFSHRDIDAAARLLAWMGLLGGLEDERCLLVPSPTASRLERMRYIMGKAPQVFREAFVHVPVEAEVDERGWPVAPNAMFRATLVHMEQHFPSEPIFWIEPDAVPVKEGWFAELKREYLECGKPFMGGYVPHGTNHMTGNGWYPANWRALAPLLAKATTEAWDTYASDQVVPKAHFTKRIQHIFNRPIIRTLKILEPGVVLFHQDKPHQLMHLLDKEEFGGRFFLGQPDIFEDKTMTKYYHTTNATKPLKAMGYEFKFTAYNNLGGVWRGVLETTQADEQAALDGLAANPKSGVTEITEAQFNERLKKKPEVKRTSHVFDPRLPLQAQTVEARAKPAVVNEPPPIPTKSPTPLPEAQGFEIGEVAPSEQPVKPRRKKKAE